MSSEERKPSDIAHSGEVREQVADAPSGDITSQPREAQALAGSEGPGRKTGMTRRKFFGQGAFTVASAFLSQFLPPFIGRASAAWNYSCYPNCGTPFCDSGCWGDGYTFSHHQGHCECWWTDEVHGGTCYAVYRKLIQPPNQFLYRYCVIGGSCSQYCYGSYWCQYYNCTP